MILLKDNFPKTTFLWSGWSKLTYKGFVVKNENEKSFCSRDVKGHSYLFASLDGKVVNSFFLLSSIFYLLFFAPFLLGCCIWCLTCFIASLLGSNNLYFGGRTCRYVHHPPSTNMPDTQPSFVPVESHLAKMRR